MERMSEELKACPFCGELPMPTIEGEISKIWFYCENRKCIIKGIKMPKSFWQLRPLEDALRKQLEKALQTLSDLRKLLKKEDVNAYNVRPFISIIDNTLAEIERIEGEK
jgi:hypothetical protein